MADEKDNPQGAEQTTQGNSGLTVRPPVHLGQVVGDLDQAWRMAKYIAQSELAPKDFRGKPENVMVAIMWGAELGIKPMAALQNIAVINGRPSVWGDLALAIVVNHPEYEDHEESLKGEGDSLTAICTIKRKDKKPCTRKFSVADARRAKLWGREGPWSTYPQRMLQMRARSWAIRDRFSDALKGLHIAEESADVPQILTVPDEQPAVESAAVKSAEEVEAAISAELGHKPGIEDFSTGRYREAAAKVLTERDAANECRRLLRDVLKTDKSGDRFNEAKITVVLGRYKGRAVDLLAEIKTEISRRESGATGSGGAERRPASGAESGGVRSAADRQPPAAAPAEQVKSPAERQRQQPKQPQQGFGF